MSRQACPGFTCHYTISPLVSLSPISRSSGRPLSIKMDLADPNRQWLHGGWLRIIVFSRQRPSRATVTSSDPSFYAVWPSFVCWIGLTTVRKKVARVAQAKGLNVRSKKAEIEAWLRDNFMLLHLSSLAASLKLLEESRLLSITFCFLWIPVLTGKRNELTTGGGSIKWQKRSQRSIISVASKVFVTLY